MGRDQRNRARACAPVALDGGHGAEHEQKDGGQLPRARCGQPRQQTKAPCERAGDGANGVGRVCEPDLLPNPAPSLSEERDELWKLIAGDERRRQHDERRHNRPARGVGWEPGDLQRLQRHCQDGEPIAQRKGRRDGRAFEEAGRRKAGHRRRLVAGDERVEQAAQADASQRDRQHEAEREHGAPEQRRQHPVPHQLHQEEREADRAGGGEQEPLGCRVRGAGCWVLCRVLGAGCGAGCRVRCRVLKVRSVWLQPDEPRRASDKEIARRCDPDRGVRPERFQHPERGSHAADNGAEGIEGVERGDILTTRVRVARGGARRRGERPAHRHGRHHEDERAQDQPCGSGHEPAQGGRPAAEQIERADDEEQ